MYFLLKAGTIALTAAIYMMLWNIYPPSDLLSVAVWILLFVPAIPAVFVMSMVVLTVAFEVPIALLGGYVRHVLKTKNRDEVPW
jgi:hypothetical protein